MWRHRWSGGWRLWASASRPYDPGECTGGRARGGVASADRIRCKDTHGHPHSYGRRGRRLQLQRLRWRHVGSESAHRRHRAGHDAQCRYGRLAQRFSRSLGRSGERQRAHPGVPRRSPAFPGAAPADFETSITSHDPPLRFTFTARAPGTYALACGVPGHALIGMWGEFDVVDGLSAPFATTN
jgi:Sulfocyanin (SoxE) domain